jgi:hypothetical protein
MELTVVVFRRQEPDERRNALSVLRVFFQVVAPTVEGPVKRNVRINFIFGSFRLGEPKLLNYVYM